jgi:hypothetical protein
MDHGPTAICYSSEYLISPVAKQVATATGLNQHIFFCVTKCHTMANSSPLKQDNSNYDRTRKADMFFFSTLLDLTDVCPLSTKQYIQVGLQKKQTCLL